MTEKEKAKAYDEAIERAKKLYGDGIAEGIFPELKESDDDRIRKWIIDDIRYNMNNEPLNNSEYKKKAEKAIAWLENQDKNSTDKTKSGFDVGDWVVLITSKSVYQVEKKENYEYTLRHISGSSMCLPFSNEVLIREWTIEDARDGDVLSLYTEYKGNKITQIGIIEKYAGEYIGCSGHTFKIYAGVNWANNLQIGKYMGCSDIHPATKEQRDILFQKIKEAGYEWDADKKELKKSVGSKFNVGNWYQCTKDIFDKGVTFNKNTAYYCTKEGCLQDEYGCHIVIVKDLYDNFKLWTIQDANDGDILATWSGPFIYNGNNGGGSCPGSYCGINTLGNFQIGVEHHWTGKKVYPATKEQRDLLFQKIKEACYEWDAEKKELKKSVEPKFKVGDWIISSVLGTAHIIGTNDSNEFQLEYIDGKQKFSSIDYVNYAYDKWTINNVKDGDVLFTSSSACSDTFVFKSIDEKGNAECYFAYDSEDGFTEGKYHFIGSASDCKPATKAQCDFLMKAMKDAGYEWDSEKKELKKLEVKSNWEG